MKLKKIILILTVALTALSCKKDDDDLIQSSLDLFEKVEGEIILPDWAVGTWYSENAPLTEFSFKKKILGGNNKYIHRSNDKVIIMRLFGDGDLIFIDGVEEFIYDEIVKIDSKTIKRRNGRIKKNDKKCNCEFYVYKKVE